MDKEYSIKLKLVKLDYTLYSSETKFKLKKIIVQYKQYFIIRKYNLFLTHFFYKPRVNRAM